MIVKNDDDKQGMLFGVILLFFLSVQALFQEEVLASFAGLIAGIL